ncbi:MAG: glucose-1-phosphate adenylyltransferase [Candidatus Omnitrophica bacterium]|nr:glucose-1-phosphate adenylyltransferase [Candidatus Omnitrophota bacterium]
MNGQVITLIMGGGQGKRLFPLTSYRSKPAVPIGGKYRLVDIPISNAINSGFRRIFVLTQFNSTSLHRHIHRTYPYESFNQTSVELLAAEQTLSNTDWFQGTADAVRKHMSHYRMDLNDTMLILSGDHLYRMDYREIIKFHEEKGADVTIATVPVPKRIVSHFGIMQLQANGQIAAFREKPSAKENIRSFGIPVTMRKAFGVDEKKDLYLASMGIYVFRAESLIEVLSGNEADFGREIIPKAIAKHRVYGYIFNDYWRDIGTIGSFYEANIELTKPKPSFNFLEVTRRIFTRPRFLPPSKVIDSKLNNVLIPEGCILEGATITDSVVGLRSVIREGTVIKKSVLMGNDFYEAARPAGMKAMGIGKNCCIQNCILDKNVRIGDDVEISNIKQLQEEDGENYHIRDGIVIVPKGASIASGTKI